MRRASAGGGGGRVTLEPQRLIDARAVQPALDQDLVDEFQRHLIGDRRARVPGVIDEHRLRPACRRDGDRATHRVIEMARGPLCALDPA